MKNKNLYIGYLVSDLRVFSKISQIDFLLVDLKFHIICEKDKLTLSQYYDYSVNMDDIFINLNFKEVESISYRSNPEGIWKSGERIDAEMLKKMFNYKLIDFSEK